MKVKWVVNDGYVSGGRYHYTEIPDEDLEDLSDEEREEMISDYIEEDFRQKITWSKA